MRPSIQIVRSSLNHSLRMSIFSSSSLRSNSNRYPPAETSADGVGRPTQARREQIQLAVAGGASLLCWLTAIAAGRMIGYW